MVASGSRTMIAGSLSSCIAGFHQSCRFSQSFGPTSCVGTGPAFAATGVEVAPRGRATADRHGAARIDPPDERRKSALGRAMHPLLKLGFEVAQSSVAKYMVKRRGPPSQGWRTFSRNHAPA